MKRRAGQALRRSCVTGAVLAAWGTCAVAQETAAPDAALPVVRVKGQRTEEPPSEQTGRYAVGASQTATKMNLSARETPQSISVVTRTQIDDFGLRNANDVLGATTGVNVERVETDRTYFSVRGFEVNNFQFDGIGLPFTTGDQQGDLDTALYDRVEVLRGANGLMSSTGTPAATVNFVRKRPTADFRAAAGVTVGSWDKRRLDVDVSGTLNAAGSVRGRLVLGSERGNSWLDRYSLRKHVGSAIVEADLGPETLLTIGHAEQHNKPHGSMWGALPLVYADGTRIGYDASASSAPSWTYWNTTDKQSFGELTQRLAGGWQLKGNVTRHVLESDAQLLFVTNTSVETDGSGIGLFPSRYGSQERQWMADIHATGPFQLGGRTHQAVFGANWARSHSELRSVYASSGGTITLDQMLAGEVAQPVFGDTVGGAGSFVDRRTGAYAAAQLQLADGLKLMPGVNLSRVASAGLQYGVVHNYQRTKVNPYAGLTYDLSRSLTAYASWTTIFKPQYELTADGSVMAPIEGRSVEAGLKGEWFDRRLTGSFAVFRTQQKNTAVYAGFNSTAGYSYYEAVDATSTGFELEAAGSVAPGWELSGGYTQFRLKDDSGNDATPFVPRRTLKVNTTAKVPGVDGLKLGAGVSWQASIYRNIGSATVQQPAYALLNLMARYDLNRQWALTAQINNATDRRYLTSLKWDQSYTGAPRNVAVNLTWKY